MRRFVIAVAGLCWVAGCAGEPVQPVETLPPLGQTFADAEDPDVKSCLTTVSRNLGTPAVVATGVISLPEGTTVTIDADGARYECHVDANGRVTAMIPMSGR